ncbi:hypothetical protein MTO96_027827 [Rhipicephalus appendiculatus]
MSDQSSDYIDRCCSRRIWRTLYRLERLAYSSEQPSGRHGVAPLAPVHQPPLRRTAWALTPTPSAVGHVRTTVRRNRHPGFEPTTPSIPTTNWSVPRRTVLTSSPLVWC